MKCQKCGGTGKTYKASVDLYSRCDECRGTGTIMKTNDEWFCGLSTEEKAEFLGDIWGRGYLTSHFEGNLEFGKKQDKAYWIGWLKEKYE